MDDIHVVPATILAIVLLACQSINLQVGRSGGRGRPRTEFRKILNSIWCYLRSNVPWRGNAPSEHLAHGVIAHRWFGQLVEAGVLQLAFVLTVALYVRQGRAKLRQFGIHCTIVPAPCGGEARGPSPVDRGKGGTKITILVDGNGRPVAVTVSPGSVHHIRTLCPPVDELVKILGDPVDLSGAKVVGDRGFDCTGARSDVLRRGMRPEFLPRGHSYAGDRRQIRRMRQFTERAIAWLKHFPAIRIRRVRRERRFLALLHMAMMYVLLRSPSEKAPATQLSALRSMSPVHRSDGVEDLARRGHNASGSAFVLPPDRWAQGVHRFRASQVIPPGPPLAPRSAIFQTISKRGPSAELPAIRVRAGPRGGFVGGVTQFRRRMASNRCSRGQVPGRTGAWVGSPRSVTI